MKIERTMKVADRVLAQIEKIMDKKDGVDLGGHVWAETYKNGRENGYGVVYASGLVCRKVVFSENRNSDHIVVYMGKGLSDFRDGNVPSEDVYKERKLFAGSNVNKAAQAIVRHLLVG